MYRRRVWSESEGDPAAAAFFNSSNQQRKAQTADDPRELSSGEPELRGEGRELVSRDYTTIGGNGGLRAASGGCQSPDCAAHEELRTNVPRSP